MVSIRKSVAETIVTAIKLQLDNLFPNCIVHSIYKDQAITDIDSECFLVSVGDIKDTGFIGDKRWRVNMPFSIIYIPAGSLEQSSSDVEKKVTLTKLQRVEEMLRFGFKEFYYTDDYNLRAKDDTSRIVDSSVIYTADIVYQTCIDEEFRETMKKIDFNIQWKLSQKKERED